MLSLLWRGAIIGFLIAVPLGPIGILCIRRSLSSGHLAGLITGVGAATADMIYGMVAVFSLAIISNFLLEQRDWIALAGGIMLILFAIREWRVSRRGVEALEGGIPPLRKAGLIGHFLSSFLLTLSNPATILSFVAMIGAAGFVFGVTTHDKALYWLVVGVFLGSVTWWISLSTLVVLIRKHLGPRLIQMAGYVAAIILALFGFYVAGQAVIRLSSSLL